ncbi:addiction module protein [Rhodopirellula europaea]|uniref:addiction module protein n=1 Tax=Rhodopirellula europaea TaxID=1263866 RepID=UPI003D2A8F24
MSIKIPLDSMSVADKMETIWSSLCQNSGDVQSPEWHKDVLAERARRLASGEATVSTWSDARARLLKRGQ